MAVGQSLRALDGKSMPEVRASREKQTSSNFYAQLRRRKRVQNSISVLISELKLSRPVMGQRRFGKVRNWVLGFPQNAIRSAERSPEARASVPVSDSGYSSCHREGCDTTIRPTAVPRANLCGIKIEETQISCIGLLQPFESRM